MQKKIIALAVAGLMSGTAFAQSNVEIYGIIDMGYANSSHGQAGTKSLVQSGMLSDSRLGFRGTEDLGGGMKANFNFEHGLNVDTGDATTATTATTAANGFWARTATVGLSGNFGAVNLGRQYTPIFNVMAASDVSINSAIVSDFAATQATARSSNSIKYTSPNFSGFTAQVLWASGENLTATATADKKTANELGYSLAYAAGPLSVGVAEHVTNSAINDKNKETAFGISYDFKVVKVFYSYTRDKDSGSAATATENRKRNQIQAAFGAGPGTAVISYYTLKDREVANGDSKGIGLAYLYPMSKRTTAYVAWGKRSNDNGATTAINKGVATVTAGYDPKLLGIGLRHSF
jgi:predicted porin